MDIIFNCDEYGFGGCDAVVRLAKEWKNSPVKLLQLTDMQIIDSMQMRTPDRLRPDEISAWHPDMMEANLFDHIKSVITQTNPDMIFITGDMVYGSFDDSGTSLMRFCKFMDSLKIPWAPAFGNHDNETKMGVRWQCNMLENSKYSLFRRGNVSGNGNYTVGLAIGEELVRIIHILDSHGCLSESGIYPDQLDMVRKNTGLICRSQGSDVPAFIAFHHPTDEFLLAEKSKGYNSDDSTGYVIGVDTEAKNDDFGSKLEIFKKNSAIVVPGFMELLKECNIDAVFVGHFHSINTCITHENIKWVFGLKTGQYDYHVPGQLGGTLVTLDRGQVNVSHVPALVNYAPFPAGSRIFNDFFVGKITDIGDNNDKRSTDNF